MRRNKTILDVLREAQGQAEKKGLPGKNQRSSLESGPGTGGLGKAGGIGEEIPNPAFEGNAGSQGSSRKQGSSIFSRFRAWFLEHPGLGGGLSLAVLFLIVLGVVQFTGTKSPRKLSKANQEKTASNSGEKDEPFQKKPSGLGNAPRLMGGGKTVPTVETASNDSLKGKKARQAKRNVDGNGSKKLKPETWATKRLRFFRISSYKNPNRTVSGYASSMARFLRSKGFLADHAWLKKKGSKQLIVYVRIPQGLSKMGEANLFANLRSLGFVRKSKDKTDDGFQFDFRKLKKNIGRASFRVRVGETEKN
jgi:hypothetical protein